MLTEKKPTMQYIQNLYTRYDVAVSVLVCAIVHHVARTKYVKIFNISILAGC